MLKELKTFKKLILCIFILLLSFSCNEKSEIKTKIINPKNQNKIIDSEEINYQNENTDVCIYYEVENAIAPGNYEVEIYADNNKIGITSFALK